MARWSVYALVLMQAAFLVLGEDAETSTEAATNGAVTATPTVSVVPTRVSVPPTTKPPLIHNASPALNATEVAPKITTRNQEPDDQHPTNSTETKEKSAAPSPNAYSRIMMGSFIGVILFSAISFP